LGQITTAPLTDLEKKIIQSQSSGQKLIVSDGVFSMEGNIVNLPKLPELASNYNCHIMLDCVHAVGVTGKNGAGTASHFGLTDSVDLIGGTFSKSLASQGGFIAGSSIAIEYLKHAAILLSGIRGKKMRTSTGDRKGSPLLASLVKGRARSASAKSPRMTDYSIDQSCSVLYSCRA
jgi:hypothetical protein